MIVMEHGKDNQISNIIVDQGSTIELLVSSVNSQFCLYMAGLGEYRVDLYRNLLIDMR